MKLLAETINLVPSDYATIAAFKPSNYILAGINIMLGLSGVVSFLFLLFGGFQWITAGGDKDGIEKARRKISFSLIGLAIIFSSYALMFIVQALFNINLLQFDLKLITTYT